MNTSKINILVLLILALLANAPLPAQVIVNLSSGFSFLLNDSDNATALATGDLVQFGYYSSATQGDPFAGTFIALTGNGGSTPATMIGGDANSGAPDGAFGYANLDLNIPADAVANATVMSFRIFDGPTIASSSSYAVAADTSTLWSTASDGGTPSPQNFYLDDPGVVWLGGSSVAGYTSISLTSAALSTPEPETLPLLAGGLVLLAWWRRTRIHRA